MTSNKVGRVQAHLDRLYNKLSRRLAQRVAAEAAVEPNTRPPCPVGLVVLELARQEYRNEDLEYAPLDGYDGDEAEDGVRGVPAFEEPLYGLAIILGDAPAAIQSKVFLVSGAEQCRE